MEPKIRTARDLKSLVDQRLSRRVELWLGYSDMTSNAATEVDVNLGTINEFIRTIVGFWNLSWLPLKLRLWKSKIGDRIREVRLLGTLCITSSFAIKVSEGSLCWRRKSVIWV